MNSVIGAVLPSALGIAISPVAIIAVIVALASPRKLGSVLGFLVGWILGSAVIVVAVELLASIIPASDFSMAPVIAGSVLIVLGALLILMASGQLRTRPGPGELDRMPSWVASVGAMTMARAFVVGLLEVVANPKNLLLLIAGGLVIGVGSLPLVPLAITIAIYVVIAALSLLIAAISHLVAARKVTGPAETVRAWLVAHNSAILAVVMFIVGVVVIGQGITAF